MSEARVGGALGAWLVLSGALGAPNALADEDPRQWLADMNTAVQTLTYEGVYVHLSDGRDESFSIAHRYAGGHIRERLVSLSASGREVVRNDAEIECFLPDQRRVLVESHAQHGSLLGTLPADERQLENYRLVLGPRERSVLGHEARWLSVIPKDRFRFGYRLQIDEKTRMPVRTELRDPSGQHVLARVLFTSLKVGGPIADAQLRPSMPTEGYTWVRQSREPPPPRTGAVIPWQVVNAPAGFKVSSSSVELLPGDDGPVTHLVLSDGLAMVSVFIAGPTPPHRASDGQGRFGAAFVFSRVLGDRVVTAVGEVPAETVQTIAAGVTPVTNALAGSPQRP